MLSLKTTFWGVMLLAVLAKGTEPQILLPLNCSELLPDHSTFLGYFESVGRGQVTRNKRLSQRIFKVLALRQKLQDSTSLYQGRNPIDALVRGTLCFYRQQKDALSPVPFDSPAIVSFISESMNELEGKVEAVILETEYRKAVGAILRKKAQMNEEIIDQEKQLAARKAQELFKVLSDKALRKAKKES